MSSNRKRLWKECLANLRKEREIPGWNAAKWNYSIEYGKLVRKDKLRDRRDAMLRSGSLPEEYVTKINEMLESEDESNWEIARGIMEYHKQEAKRIRLSKRLSTDQAGE